MAPQVHRMLTINPLSRTGVCRNCGPVEIAPRRRKGVTTWVCKVGRDEQRGTRGPRTKAEGRRRSPWEARPKEKCAACGIKPRGEARVILKVVRGYTLCANCRVLYRSNPIRFVRATDLELPKEKP